MKKMSFLFVVIAALSMVVLPYTGGNSALGAMKNDASVMVKAGHIDGVVTDSQGAVVETAAIRILDNNESVTAESVSGKDGRFSFNCPAEGKYTLVVNDTYVVWFEVANNGSVSEIRVTLSNDSAQYSAGDLASSSGIPSIFVTGGVIATAVAVPVALHNIKKKSCP